MAKKKLDIKWREILAGDSMIVEDFITDEGFRFVVDTKTEDEDDAMYIVSVSVTTSGSSGESDVVLQTLFDSDDSEISVDDVVTNCYNQILDQRVFSQHDVHISKDIGRWKAPNGWLYSVHDDNLGRYVFIESTVSDVEGGISENIRMDGGDWSEDIDISDDTTAEWIIARHYTLFGWLERTD